MIAIFNKKNIFGKDTLYPGNEAAETICSILKFKTMPYHYIHDFTKLGIEIHIEGDKPEIFKAV